MVNYFRVRELERRKVSDCSQPCEQRNLRFERLTGGLHLARNMCATSLSSSAKGELIFIFTTGCVDPYALMTNFLHGYVLPFVFRAMVMLNLRILIRWLVVV